MIDIEFNPRPGPSKPWWLALGLLAVLACVAWGFAGWSSIERSRLERAIAEKRAALDERRRSTALRAAEALTPPYASAAWEVWRRGRFEAAEALSAIEATSVEGIALQALEVIADHALVKVELTASDHERLHLYLDHLNAGLPSPRWRIAQVSMGSTRSSGGLRVTLIHHYSEQR